MLTVALLSLLFTVGDHASKSAKPSTRYGFSGVPKAQRGKSVSSGLMSIIEGNNHPSSSVGMRTFCHYCAARNVEKVNSKVPSSSIPERSKDEPWYWIDEKCDNNFKVSFREEDEDESKRISKLRFKICGNPRPLQRHRSSRWRTYNPSVKYQKSFQDSFKQLVSNYRGESVDYPLFDANEFLVMTIIFRMKRPKSHFVNNRPGPGRLKEKSPSQLSSIRSDVDNLTKFVLDSMNEVIYEDDRQITSVHATKLLDNDDLCAGSIEVYVRSIEDEDVEKILESSISIVE